MSCVYCGALSSDIRCWHFEALGQSEACQRLAHHCRECLFQQSNLPPSMAALVFGLAISLGVDNVWIFSPHEVKVCRVCLAPVAATSPG